MAANNRQSPGNFDFNQTVVSLAEVHCLFTLAAMNAGWGRRLACHRGVVEVRAIVSRVARTHRSAVHRFFLHGISAAVGVVLIIGTSAVPAAARHMRAAYGGGSSP